MFLAGRTGHTVKTVATEIAADGGRAHHAVIDALDGSAIEDYVASIVKEAGALDIEFNATGPRINESANGKPAVALTESAFMTPVETVLRSQFLTAQAAARHMVDQGSGVIIFLTGSPAKPLTPGTSAIGAAFRRRRKPHKNFGARARTMRGAGGLPSHGRQSRLSHHPRHDPGPRRDDGCHR